MSIENRKILITGGSSGLGRALVESYTRLGACVAFVARSADNVAEVARATGATGIVGDISSKDDIYRIAGLASNALGDINGVIHCAGYLGSVPLRGLIATDCEDLERSFSVNVVGPHRLNKILLPGMLVRNDGFVVTISSDAAIESYPGWGSYGMGKAALDHMLATYAAEHDSTRIRFLAIDPGEMNTKMHADALPDSDPSTLRDPKIVAAKIIETLEEGQSTTGRIQIDFD